MLGKMSIHEQERHLTPCLLQKSHETYQRFKGKTTNTESNGEKHRKLIPNIGIWNKLKSRRNESKFDKSDHIKGKKKTTDKREHKMIGNM